MMSSSIVAILLFSSILAYFDASLFIEVDAANDTTKMVHDLCAKESSLLPDDIKRITDGKIHGKDAPAASRNLQCYVLCSFKKLDIIGADDKPKIDGIVKFLDSKVQDKSKIKTILEKCAAAVKGANACESAFNFEGCLFEQIKA